ncbi:hypothetical protein CPB85DRAFT_481549 [Mucidula mucida]|nr:hypothetical protein CPB85DRAFT_481549 [Mucidula mucida]
MSIPTQTSEIQRIAQSVPEAVQPLAHSNDAPTERQLNIMYTWKNSLDAALASLPDAATQNLLRRSVIIASHRLLYRSVCSAVRRLPVEILQAIFLEFVDADSQQHGYDVFNVNVGPWPLIRVSRLWRAVGLGCPELWANISVHRQTSWARRKRPLLMRGPITLLRMALAHSGQRDLYIYFMDVGSDASTLLRALVEHSNRWTSGVAYHD